MKFGSDKVIEDILSDAKRAATSNIEHYYAWMSELCESPIERIVVATLLHPDIANEFETRISFMRPKIGTLAHVSPPPFPGIWVYPQIVIGDYRVDFLIVDTSAGRASSLVIECDGHDFHEKTKEQAQRDKARDRYLVGQGHRIIRFTGSEIYRDPYSSVTEALHILMGTT